RTVRIGDDISAPAAPLLLLLDDGDVIGIQLRNEERYIGIHAMVARIRNDYAAAVRIIVFRFARHGRIEAGENDVRLQLRTEGLDRQHAGVGRHQRVETPAGRFRVRLARAALGRDDLVQLEPWMAVEKLHESLADGSSGAED